MKYMLPNELEELIREYDYATGLSDSQIKEKLRKIEDCYNECSSNEKVFADAITVLFCRTIGILRKQLLSAEAAANIPRDPVDDPDHSYSATCSCDYDCIPFSDGNSLRIAFYNYFRNEKKKNGKEQVQYPEINSLDDLKGEAVNSTMRDYVARIQTFANGYLCEMPRIAELWQHENNRAHVDPVLFTYRHLELILACFTTKEYTENGEKILNKQKNNIRSALRKLNDFKLAQGTHR